VLGLLLAANFVSATQDIATDGLAVEMLRAPELGWANGLQIGGFSLGMIVGGALTVVAYEHGGWQTSFLVLAAAMALTLVPVLATNEGSRGATPRQDSTLRSLPSLANMLRRPGAGAMLFIAGMFYFCTTMVSSMKGPFLVDAGLSLTEAGIVGGTSAATISIAGAGLGSLLVHRFGATRTAIWGGAVSALLLGLWLIPAVSKAVDLPTAIAITLAIGLASGAAYVAFFTIFMAWASPDQAGTDFTVLQCTESWTNIAASVLAGQIAGTMGFAALFAVAPILGLVLVALIAILLFRLDRGAGKVRQAGTAEAPC
jgi:PAT family beta-lactamase induction signal transducer AmpG